jgi:HK97 family phage major capsid protein
MLAGHTDPVGVWDSIAVDGEGLKVAGRLLVDDVPEAKSTRALVRAGAVTGLSVGFITKKSAPRTGGGRTISDLDLVEVSIVAVPANPGATVTNIKEAALAEENTAEAVQADVETKAALAAANDNIAKLTARLDAAEVKLARPAIVTKKDDEPSAEQKAFGDYLRLGSAAPELKTLTVSSDPQGGYLAPPEMATEFVRNLVQFSPIRSVASVRSTTSPSVLYPKRTAVTTAGWTAEAADSSESEPTFGQVVVVAHEATTYVDISNKLLADSAGAAEAEVRLALAEDFGKLEGSAFVDGDGAGKPMGFMTDASVGYTAGGDASKVTGDGLISLFYALPAVYRGAGTWLMNSTSLDAIRKLKDSTTGAYIWQPALAAGQPETILGRPVVEAVDMDDVAANAFPIAFGDFATAYRIVDRVSLSILVNPYSLATKGVTRIHATRRVGGAVIQPAAIRKLKIATA